MLEFLVNKVNQFLVSFEANEVGLESFGNLFGIKNLNSMRV